MSQIRRILGRVCAAYFFARTGGRMRGKSFLMQNPSRLVVRKGASIRVGEGVFIGKGARVIVEAHLTIGAGVYIGKNATVVVMDRVEIGERVLIGENVSIHSEDHGPPEQRLAFTTAPVQIGSDAWICAGVVVTKGCSVGHRTTVAANAVVTKNLPDGVLAGGIPARVIKRLDQGDHASA